MEMLVEDMTPDQRRAVFDDEGHQQCCDCLSDFWVSDSEESINTLIKDVEPWATLIRRLSEKFYWDEHFRICNVTLSAHAVYGSEMPKLQEALKALSCEFSIKHQLLLNCYKDDICFNQHGGLSIDSDILGGIDQNDEMDEEHIREELANLFGLEYQSGDNEWTDYARNDNGEAIQAYENEFFEGQQLSTVFKDLQEACDTYTDNIGMLFHLGEKLADQIQTMMREEYDYRTTYEYWEDMAIANEWTYTIDTDDEEQEDE